MVYRALVQIFVGFDLVTVLVPDPDEQEASLSAVDGDLTDDFVEALVEEFLTDGTKSYFSSHFVDKFFVEFLVELDDFDLGGRRRENGLDPELSVVGAVLLGRQDLSEDILGVMELLLSFLFVGSTSSSRQQHRSRVLH